MKTIRLWMALAALCVVATPAGAQDKIDKDSSNRWGGAWAVDCKDAKSKRVTLYEDHLVYEGAGKKVASKNAQVASSWLGNSPPENYVTTFLGDLGNDKQMVLSIYTDDKGEYMIVDGDDPALKMTVEQAQHAPHYRHCVAAAKPVDATATTPDTKPAPGTLAAETLPGPAEMLATDAAFKSAYMKALGRYSKEPWLTELTGPSAPTTKVTVDGIEYTAINCCKPHDCADNTMVAFYSAAKKKVYGKVVIAGKSALVGNPPPAVAKEIGALWFQQFKSNP